MDSEWVGRAGILAEIVSFLLIAPEILGEERLRNAEEAFRIWLGGFHQHTRRFFSLWAVTTAVFFVAAALVISAATDRPAVLILGIGVGAAWASVDTKIVLLLIAAVRRLLAGPNRLRALVFGTGVVLLFGGLGAQLYATF
jgi:hypothetical protein